MPRKSKAARDNRANQLNRNNDAYWRARGVVKPGYVKRLLDRQEQAQGVGSGTNGRTG